MATDSILGLFTTPEQYQQAQNEAALARGVQLAQLDPFQRASAQLYQGGYMAGGALGQALGAQDPVLQKISQQQSILKDVDFTDAASLSNAARQAVQIGRPDLAQQLAARAIDIQTKVDEKQAAREQALAIAQERNRTAKEIASERAQTSKELAAERNAIQLQIAQMNNSLKNANSDVQRQLIEQRIEDLKGKAAEKESAMQSQAQGRVAAFDSALDTLDIISKHPGKKDVVGALTGGLMSIVPGTNAAGFASQLETFKAQTFIPQVSALKGMGALSDAEGKKLTAAVGALDVKMKPAEFDASIARIKADLEAAKQRAAKMPGMPKSTSFNSVEEATRANLPKGTIITINGRRAVVE